jgi:predicted hotdog family 3-hydroxylacyl-ACP dehydratase
VRNRSLDLPVAAGMLLPQRPPLLAVDYLTEFHSGGGVVESTIAPDGIFVTKDGSVEPTVFVELIAQAFATVKGYEDMMEGNRVAKGFLVEVKGFEVLGAAQIGDKLSIVIKKVGETDDFALAEGTVMRETEAIACGKVMVWVPKEEAL